MSNHQIIVNISIKEFQGGDKLNEVNYNMMGDQELIPLFKRLLDAVAVPEVTDDR